MEGINNIAFTTNKAFQRSNKTRCISNIYCWTLQQFNDGESKIKTDLVLTKVERKSKEVVNL